MKLFHWVSIFSGLSAVDDSLHLVDIFYGRGQVIITILSDQDVILDADTTDGPVLVQHLKVDVCSVDRVAQVWLNDEVAEVNLCLLVAIV